MYKYFFKIFIIILFVICFVPQNIYSLEIYHPEKSEMSVSEKGIFFCGNINCDEKLYINDVEIKPEGNGAFIYSVNLIQGLNLFNVTTKRTDDSCETITYNITRTPGKMTDNNKFINIPQNYYTIIKDTAILRSTPIDFGINRLGYLPKDTKVFVDAKKNNFYRVYLKKDTYGWIICRDLKKLNEQTCYTPKSIISKSIDDKNNELDNVIYTFNLSENVPYSTEYKNGKLHLRIYNLDTQDEYIEEEIEPDKFPKYNVEMKDNSITVVVKHQNPNLNIIIDPGHGGSERGTIGCFGDKEKDYNLKIALELKEILTKNGFNVLLTRESDDFVSLNDRTKLAKDNNADIFVSIHMNSIPIDWNPNKYSGAETYYYNPQSKQLAEIVQNQLTSDLNLNNGGIKQSSLAVIRPTDYIGILVELAYMINPKDSLIYKDETFIHNSAMSIFKAIDVYVKSLKFDN